MNKNISLLFLLFTVIFAITQPINNTSNLRSNINLVLNDQKNNSKQEQNKINQIDNYPNFNYFFDYVWNTSLKELEQQKNKQKQNAILTPVPDRPNINFSQTVRKQQVSPNINIQNSINRSTKSFHQNSNDQNKVTYHIIFADQETEIPKNIPVISDSGGVKRNSTSVQNKQQGITKRIYESLTRTLIKYLNQPQGSRLKPISIIKQYNSQKPSST